MFFDKHDNVIIIIIIIIIASNSPTEVNISPNSNRSLTGKDEESFLFLETRWCQKMFFLNTRILLTLIALWQDKNEPSYFKVWNQVMNLKKKKKTQEYTYS